MNSCQKISLVVFLSLAQAFSAADSSGSSAADSAVHKKSLWESFVGFFSSKPEPKGEGDLYRQLADLENEIQDTKWRYTRETRAVRKNNYRLHLMELKNSRDSLEALIEAGTANLSSADNVSSAREGSSSSAEPVSSAEKLSSAAGSSSSAACETLVRTDSVFVTTTISKIVHDTLIVHDTVRVHDTVYVREGAADSFAGDSL